MHCLSLIESHLLWKQSSEASSCVEVIGGLLLLMNGLLIMEAKVLKNLMSEAKCRKESFLETLMNNLKYTVLLRDYISY